MKNPHLPFFQTPNQPATYAFKGFIPWFSHHLVTPLLPLTGRFLSRVPYLLQGTGKVFGVNQVPHVVQVEPIIGLPLRGFRQRRHRGTTGLRERPTLEVFLCGSWINGGEAKNQTRWKTKNVDAGNDGWMMMNNSLVISTSVVAIRWRFLSSSLKSSTDSLTQISTKDLPWRTPGISGMTDFFSGPLWTPILKWIIWKIYLPLILEQSLLNLLSRLFLGVGTWNKNKSQYSCTARTTRGDVKIPTYE